MYTCNYIEIKTNATIEIQQEKQVRKQTPILMQIQLHMQTWMHKASTNTNTCATRNLNTYLNTATNTNKHATTHTQRNVM